MALVTHDDRFYDAVLRLKKFLGKGKRAKTPPAQVPA
jgi:hypothetical protein